LIPKAGPHGRGRAQGVEWLYPPGTDRTLRTVFRLKERGYRGDMLPFALWWLGVRPWTPGVARYVDSLFRYSQQRLQVDVHEQGCKAGVPSTAVDHSSDDVDGLAMNDVARTYADQGLRLVTPKLLEQIDRALDASSAFTADQLSRVVLVWLASMLGYFPEDIDVEAFFLERELPPRVVSAMHLPDWYDDLMTRVPSASAGLYDLARLMLRPRLLAWESEDRYNAAQYQLAGFLTLPTPLTRDYLRLVKCLGDLLRPKLSTRTQQRLGPWARPALAARGLLVGLTVFWITMVEKQSREVGT
jgi:hypothetical protein